MCVYVCVCKNGYNTDNQNKNFDQDNNDDDNEKEVGKIIIHNGIKCDKKIALTTTNVIKTITINE